MYSKVYCAVLAGLEGRIIEVETSVRDGLPGMDLIGALGTEVREAGDRVKTALSSTDHRLPPKKITVNLSPANLRKEGNSFDLPIAVSVMLAVGYLPEGSQEGCLFAGELGLNGDIRPVWGILPSVLCGKKNGFHRFILPRENEAEASVVDGVEIIGVRTLNDVAEYMKLASEGHSDLWKKIQASESREAPCKGQPREKEDTSSGEPDFSDVIGQYSVRRAAEVAVSGRHNFLMIGPPGSGKTMIAERMAGILPSLSRREMLEISQVYSICGLLNEETPLIRSRPFRSPHHTVTAPTLTGGGRIPKPGEVSLADHGILFLDELTEFRKQTLDTLRQPLEDGRILIARQQGSYSYPARFMLVAGMNPCPCGYYPDRTRCRCSPNTIRQYLGHVSRPLLDRIDVCAEAAPLPFSEIMSREKGESSAAIRERVLRTQEIQTLRFSGESFHFNSEIPAARINEFCPLGTEEKALMMNVFEAMHLSARGYHKILKVARTIADMEGSEIITKSHLGEAVRYRSAESKFWEDHL